MESMLYTFLPMEAVGCRMLPCQINEASKIFGHIHMLREKRLNSWQIALGEYVNLEAMASTCFEKMYTLQRAFFFF